MNSKLIFSMPLALSLVFLSCDDNEIESQLTNCARVDTFISLTEDGEPFVDEDAQLLCGRNQTELDEKIALAQQEFDEALAAALAAREVMQQPVVILNFDDLTSEFNAFNGAESMIIDNPELSGVNDTASQVLQINNTASANFEGVASAALDMDIDFSASSSKTILVDVFSDQEVVVDFQVKRNENMVTLDDPRGSSLNVTHTGTGWETLTFNYNAGAIRSFDGFSDDGAAFVPEGQFNQVVILVDGGAPASLGAASYLIDNIRLEVLAEGGDIDQEEPMTTTSISPVINFDDLTSEFSSFNGAEFLIVENPELSGVNASTSQVLQINNTATANFEGVASGALDMDIDFGPDSNKTITVDVFSNEEVVVDFQVKRNEEMATLEDPRAASLKVTHTGSGWETLTFDYNEGAVKAFDGFDDDGEAFVPEGQFNQVVILVDGGAPASLGAATYFVDNINTVE